MNYSAEHFSLTGRHLLNRRQFLSNTATALGSIALTNLLVLIFNLIPAYPLDGGRIARAAVWKATGDRTRATRASSLCVAFGRRYSR